MNSIPPADRGKAVFFAQGQAPITGIVVTASTTANRINTGLNHTIPPLDTYNYVRIFEDSIPGQGGASGQIARISGKRNGYVVVDKVWNTTSKIIPSPTGNFGDPCIFTFSETPTPTSTTLFTLPSAGDKFVLIENTRFWKASSGSPAAITVAEVLADQDFEHLNRVLISAKISTIRNLLSNAAGGNLTFRTVPVIYFGVIQGFDTNRRGLAMTPGASNFQVAANEKYFPGQFGFKNSSGTDLFQAYIGSSVSGGQFVDCWNYYHVLQGEVHCGTASVRIVPSLNWWENQP